MKWLGLVFLLLPLAGRAAEPERVIDVHWHAPRIADLPAWTDAMNAANVSQVIVIGTPGQIDALNLSEGARWIPSLTFPCEDGLAVTNGQRCFEDGSTFPPLALIRSLVAAGKLKALGEINAQYMGVAPDDERMEPYYALAEELDIPMGIHLGIAAPGVAYADSKFPPHKSPHYSGAAGNPLALETVLVRHPKLRLYVMHAAWPFLAEMQYMLYLHPQLYADLSALQWTIPRAAYYSHLRALVAAGFGKRLMFGSDGGVTRLKEGVDAVMAADFLTAEQKRDILHDNAARFFRLAK